MDRNGKRTDMTCMTGSESRSDHFRVPTEFLTMGHWSHQSEGKRIDAPCSTSDILVHEQTKSQSLLYHPDQTSDLGGRAGSEQLW